MKNREEKNKAFIIEYLQKLGFGEKAGALFFAETFWHMAKPDKTALKLLKDKEKYTYG